MKGKYKYLILILVTILTSIFIYNYIDENTEVFKEADILSVQKNIQRNILSDTNYDINNPKVILNPYEISPLTALVVFQTKDLVAVTVTIKGKDGDNDIVNNFQPSKEHLISVYGLYPNYENTVIINTSDESKVLKIKTGPLPNNIFSSNAYKGDAEEFYFTTSDDINGYPVAYDSKGNVRWYLTKHYNWDFTRLSNGYVLLGNSDLMHDPYYSSGLVEMDLLGKIYYEYNIPTGYHHDVYEKTDGNLLLISRNFDNSTKEDIIIEIDRKDGVVVKKFKLSSLLKQEILLNSLVYSPNTNSILAVGNNNMIFNIDYNTKEINWIIADDNKVDSKYKKYLLNGNGQIEFPIKPYSIVLTDNNKFAYINSSSSNSLIEYEVDPSNRTFREINNISLGKKSDTVNLDYNNNIYIATLGNDIKKISDNEVSDVMSTNYNIYSTKATKMYAGDIFVINDGVRLGSTGITPTIADHSVMFHKKDSSIIKKYNLKLSSDANRFIVKGTFNKSDNVQIILDNVLSKKTYNVNISEGVKLGDKVQTTTYINKQGVYGKYYIYLNINGVNYKLNKYVMMD